MTQTAIDAEASTAPGARTTDSTANAIDLFERHRPTLEKALEVIRTREYWTPYPEVPSGSIYGETANEDGRKAFLAYADTTFPLDQPGTSADVEVGGERSPFGFDLTVRYPRSDPDTLIAAQETARPGWRDAGVDARAGVCLEILDRLNKRSFEMGYAVMHTTGQAFVMALQAGGPHAQDRGLEGLAYAYAEQTRHSPEAHWEKPQGKRDPLRLEKRFTIVPRGISLVVGCNTFPTWNSYTGIFASLASGNPVLIKPHHRAILPMAITVGVAREVLAEAGFDPNLVCLAVAPAEEHLASALATRPEVRIIDYTGSTAYGEWLEANARQAAVFTEKSGVNSIVIDSTDDLAAMARNIAFSLSLYSGQMCTAPQNLLVRSDGITVAGDKVPLAEVEKALAGAIDELMVDPAKAVEVTGAIVNDDVLHRIEEAGSVGRTILASRSIDHPQFPDAVVRTPALIGLEAADPKSEAIYSKEWFGPVAFVVATDSTEQSLEIFRRTGRICGSITAAVYSTSDDVLAAAESAALDVGVAISCNLVGNIWVNQSAAFSDFHATGANPSANASLTDGAFVASRFRIVESRRPTD